MSAGTDDGSPSGTVPHGNGGCTKIFISTTNSGAFDHSRFTTSRPAERILLPCKPTLGARPSRRLAGRRRGNGSPRKIRSEPMKTKLLLTTPELVTRPFRWPASTRQAGLKWLTFLFAALLFTSASLTATAAQITADPQSVTINREEPASFTAGASGTGSLSFQWLKDGQPIPGANSSTFSIPSAEPHHIGFYACKVTDAEGAVTSAPAALKLNGIEFGLWQGLVAYYPFNGSAQNVTGLGFNGTVEGNTLQTTDRTGTGLRFRRTQGRRRGSAFTNQGRGQSTSAHPERIHHHRMVSHQCRNAPLSNNPQHAGGGSSPHLPE